MGAMEAGLREAHGHELRFFPSTVAQATIGGFVCGGSCGVGSINYGLLRDPGNVLGLRVATMEAEPRVLALSGKDCQAAVHAYGTNGIVTEVEVALAPAQDWLEMVVAFPTLAAAAEAAQAVCESPAIAKRNVTTLGAPVPALPGFEGLLRQITAAGGDASSVAGAGAVNLMCIGACSVEGARDICEQHGGFAHCAYESGKGADGKRRRPLYEWGWNHTTLRALSKDENITYLQCGYFDPAGPIESVLHLQERFGGAANGDEYMTHLEWVRQGGRVGAFGLPLVRWRSKERLDELIAYHNDHGSPVFNPHTFVLEDGGMKQTDAAQLAFKHENDPTGLLNPGKMRAWEEGRPVVEGVLNAFDRLREGAAAPDLEPEPLTPDMLAELNEGAAASEQHAAGAPAAATVAEGGRRAVARPLSPPAGSVRPPLANYTHGALVPGGSELVFLSGQLGIRPDGSVPEGAGEQAAVCFENVAAILAESGLGLEHVVRLNAYVSGREHLPAYMAARDAALEGLPPAASTLMVVDGFSRPELLVEVEAVAAAGGPSSRCHGGGSAGPQRGARPEPGTPASARPRQASRRWAEWTTADFAEADLSQAVAVLPLGATEAHGPHLPLGVDAMHNAALLDRALERLPPEATVLALPPLEVCVSCEHSGFAGTLEVSAETAAATWAEIGACVAKAGVRKLLLYNSHGGNHALAEVVARRLRLDHGMLVAVAMNLAQGMAPGGSVAALFPEDEVRYGIHGGALETSLMLHLRPDLVRLDAARDFASAASRRPPGAALQVHGPGFANKVGWVAQDLNEAGVVGAAASLSDAAKGAQLAEASVSALVGLLSELHAADADEWLATSPRYPPQGRGRAR
ncbi:unnamed protein product [Prorocentrum cordatum]|uniref:FAD-binding PCMH-type domain-containing protein n=1 Tax=Prorocentrum cordatum TaxID=2364126 RepID=A0ABN9Y7X6_9DINO|nr:unnamed protein product [Polarella glacialis]